MVLAGREFACIKIAGLANFSSSIDFKRLLNELQGKGYVFFVLDLSECSLMDSTFLGLLAGFGLKMGQTGTLRQIELMNANPRVSELLETLGVIHLFKLSQGNAQVPDGMEMQELAPGNATYEEIARASLEAHETLMAISPENASRFKDVAQFLAEDLKKLQKGPGA